MAAGDETQNQPEAERQAGPERQSVETSSSANDGHDQEREDKEKRREAKVCRAFFWLHSAHSSFLAVAFFCTSVPFLWAQYLRNPLTEIN